MSVLALFSASSAATPSATEFLRLLSGLAACGDAPVLLELGPGRHVLSAASSDAERYLDALSASGVVPSHDTAASLRSALLAASSVLRLADPARSGTPALLMLTDDWLSQPSRTDAEILSSVLSAGQVIRVPS